MYQLYLQDIQSIIIEGGANTLTQFIEAGLWDEARIFTGEAVFNRGIEAPKITGILATEYLSGRDELKILYSS